MSLMMAALAFFFVQSYVESIEEKTRKNFGTSIVVVKAKKDIKEMETVNETHVGLETVPKRFLEPAAIYFEPSVSDDDKKRGMKELDGLVAVVPIKKGEQITFNKLSEPNIRTGLSPQVAIGRRAISIPIDDVRGVSKLVKPGDRVDLIAVLDAGGGKENKIAKTVLQDVVVLAAGRSVTNNVPRVIEADAFGGKERVRSLAQDFSFTSVTLEVEPAQAQALALVLANGESALTLSLRNNDDTERVNTEPVMLVDVLGTAANRLQRVPAGRR